MYSLIYLFKAFNRVWHDGLLFELKQNAVSENLFQLITNFLSINFKELYLHWETICAVVPQGGFSFKIFIFPFVY